MNVLTSDLTIEPRPRRRIRRPRPTKQAVQLNKLQHRLTTVLGIGIPAMTLALSYIGGSLWYTGRTGLALAAGALVLCVLAVSLTHVARAIREVSGTEVWLSWAMAIAIDAGLVVCELATVGSAVEQYMCWAVVTCVAAASAALNVYAFRLAQKGN